MNISSSVLFSEKALPQSFVLIPHRGRMLDRCTRLPGSLAEDISWGLRGANALGMCEDDSVLKAICRFWSLRRRQGFVWVVDIAKRISGRSRAWDWLSFGSQNKVPLWVLKWGSGLGGSLAVKFVVRFWGPFWVLFWVPFWVEKVFPIKRAQNGAYNVQVH